MKLSQIKKKYPKAWAEYIDYLLNEVAIKKRITPELKSRLDEITIQMNIRDNYGHITDHFDKLGLCLETGYVIKANHNKNFECTVNYFHGKPEWVYTGNFKTRSAAETQGLTKLFSIREKQIKTKE